MKKRVHGMKRNHGTELPGQLVFFDTESSASISTKRHKITRLTHRLTCATSIRLESGQVTRRDDFQSTSIDEFWQWLDKQQSIHRPVWAFAHNLAFDLTMLRFWERLEEKEYRVGVVTPEESGGKIKGNRPFRGRMVLEGRPCFVTAIGRFGVVKFVDSMNYYPQSLASIGESLGIPKMEFPGFESTDVDMFNYCRNDVLILEKCILGLMEKWRADDCGVWQSTAPMLALTSFRHLLPDPAVGKTERTIWFDDRQEWEELERASYFGGQVSCFFVGSIDADVSTNPDLLEIIEHPEKLRPRGPVYHLDVHALYPSVMFSRKFPVMRHFKRDSIGVEELRKYLHAFGAVSRVRIRDTENEYTVRHDFQQIQARGVYWTTLCGDELIRAIDSGSVVECGHTQVYVLDTIFRDWVDYWMKRRHKSEDICDYLDTSYCKLILNSLSGKFAQHGKRWVDLPNHPCRNDGWGTWIECIDDAPGVEYRSVGGNVQRLEDGEPPWYSFPAISAYISSYGREWMRWARSLCPERSIYYQATDSLICSQEAYDALNRAGLVDEKHLGCFRLKGVYETAEIVGSNHYRIGDQWVRAGSWGRAKKQADGTYTYDSWQGVETTISTRPDGSIVIQELELERVKRYNKGQINDDGWVTPLFLPQSLDPS